jgi:hypothetical protein
MANQTICTLEVGDCVTFERGMIPAIGTVSELLDEDYVKVRWHDMSIATTHRRLALVKLEGLLP